MATGNFSPCASDFGIIAYIETPDTSSDGVKEFRYTNRPHYDHLTDDEVITAMLDDANDWSEMVYMSVSDALESQKLTDLYKFGLTPGYYDGFQLVSDETSDKEEIDYILAVSDGYAEEYVVDNVEYLTGVGLLDARTNRGDRYSSGYVRVTKKGQKALKKWLDAEMEKIEKEIIGKLLSDHCMMRLVISAQFSNGETWYKEII